MAAPQPKRRRTTEGSNGAKSSVSVSMKPAAAQSILKKTFSKPPTKPMKALAIRSTAQDSDGDDDNVDEDVSIGEDNSDNSDDDENDELNLDNVSSSDESFYSDSSTSSFYENGLKKPTDPSATSKKRKRHDPVAFSTSMSKILSSHLTTTARKDPILVRSKQAAKEIDDSKLEAKARRLLTIEKKKELDKDRIKDVLPRGKDSGEELARVLEREKALRKVAQRGVVKLFNAVRAAQMKGDQAMEESKQKGVLGMDTREKKVTEMSKEGFLDLIQTGGKK